MSPVAQIDAALETELDSAVLVAACDPDGEPEVAEEEASPAAESSGGGCGCSSGGGGGCSRK